MESFSLQGRTSRVLHYRYINVHFVGPSATSWFSVRILRPFRVFNSQLCVSVFSRRLHRINSRLITFINALSRRLTVLLFPSTVSRFLFRTITSLGQMNSSVNFSHFRRFSRFNEAFNGFGVRFGAFQANRVLSRFMFMARQLRLVLGVKDQTV